jgi:excisionase family DNA binding protein
VIESKAENWMKDLSESERGLAARGLLVVPAAAAYALVSKRWVYQQIKEGRLSARKVGKRYIILQRDIDVLLGANDAPPLSLTRASHL